MKLREMPNTVVHCKDRKEFDHLMRVFEESGWRWEGGDKPTKWSPWDKCPEDVKPTGEYIFAHDNFFRSSAGKGAISLANFLREQGIDSKGGQVEQVTRLFHSFTVYKGKDAELWHDSEKKTVRIKESRKSRTVSVADVADLPSFVEGFFASKA